jgi:hypothetical protein
MWTGWKWADPGTGKFTDYAFVGDGSLGYTNGDCWRRPPSLIFGDTEGVENDPYSTIICQTDNTAQSNNWNHGSGTYAFSTPGNSSFNRIAANVEGTLTNRAHECRPFAAYPNVTTSPIANVRNIGGRGCPNYPPAGTLFLDRSIIYEATMLVRGFLPGLYLPLFNLIEPRNFDHMGVFTEGTDEYWCVPGGMQSGTSSVEGAKGLALLLKNKPWYSA